MFSICCNSYIKSWRNKKRSKKITKIKALINKYNWEGKSFPSEKDDRQKLEKDNLTIAINVLYAKKEKIHPANDCMFLSCHVRISEWILTL